MSESLDAFLSRHTPVHETEAVWGGGTLPLRVRWYVGTAQPPLEYVTSIRCIVLHSDSVLVMRNRDGHHVWPGGRREPGETPEQTIARELMEEAGCTTGAITPIGFVHLRHLKPVPRDYPYPAPDFCWLLYAAEATAFVSGARPDDEYEEAADLVPLVELPALNLEAPADQLVQVALAALRVSPPA